MSKTVIYRFLKSIFLSDNTIQPSNSTCYREKRSSEKSEMASLCRQIIRGNALKSVLLSTARRGYADKMMPDPLEHATGLEKKELLALQSGNDDPFNMKVLQKAAGTRDNPTLVPSCFDARIVGCICEEHSTSINWLWVHKDHPRRCECGHWYKLIEKAPL